MKGTLDDYRRIGETNPDIAALVAMIDKLNAQLRKALEAVAELHRENEQRKSALRES